MGKADNEVEKTDPDYEVGDGPLRGHILRHWHTAVGDGTPR